MMTLKNDLEAAKAVVGTPDKWCKGSLSLDGKHCVLGAVEVVDPTISMQAASVLQALGRANTSGLLLMDFNDRPETTHADIMALFDRAINSAALDELRKPVDEVRE